jgi:hypothetical protein
MTTCAYFTGKIHPYDLFLLQKTAQNTNPEFQLPPPSSRRHGANILHLTLPLTQLKPNRS